ncbi:hypothetical protein RJ639_011095 [Escallonia herrerae]|uniref:DRBM domain-containing protein n=1 Tax=Escallonia herrerae TaxID=1293975 RepID=A0AA88VLE7_9ASTE|nr:hypothetical protein RJ639_011095 [Escallonia herrerae]
MFKNQLQELAQRSCFNLPSYSCIREGPDHAPRFKATVNFSGETFESPTFCSTLRQAEHAAAEVALNTLASRGPSTLAARVLDETGVYKNLLQETAHRAGLHLPVYTTVRTGPGHVPVFRCTVELAELTFTGEPAKTKKQAQKNAAMAAWSSLRQSEHRKMLKIERRTSVWNPFHFMVSDPTLSLYVFEQVSQCGLSSLSPASPPVSEEQDQVVIARFLAGLQSAESNSSLQKYHQDGPQIPVPNGRDSNRVVPRSHPIQYESWAYPSFSTEMAMYRMWQEAQFLQLQSQMLSLPPTPLPSPQVFPFMQPVFQPDQLYFPAMGQEHLPAAASIPSFHFSNDLIPAPTRGRSMVTIQEIQEEKTGSSEFCTSESLHPPILGGPKTELAIQGAVQEDVEAKIREIGQREQSSSGQFAPAPPGTTSIDSGFLPAKHQLQNQSFPRPSLRSRSEPPLSAAAPVRFRVAGPVSSVGPRPQNLANQMAAPPKMGTGNPQFSTRPRMNLGMPPRFMAPAVQIRSVVPVCSAPPARKVPSSSREGHHSDQQKRNFGKDVSSELSKLQI